jgi:hypothetical protein
MMVEPQAGRSVPDGLAGAEAPEPDTRLGPSDGIPSAWPLFGYAPGNYRGHCRICGTGSIALDKRATSCLDCAVRSAKDHIAKLEQREAAVKAFPLEEETRLECLKLAHDWAKMRFGQGYIGVNLDDITAKAGEFCSFVAASAIEARRAETQGGSVADESAPEGTPITSPDTPQGGE